MSTLRRKAVRFLADTVVGNALSSAGTQIGEAIGKRISAKIYTPPPEPKPTDAKDSK